MEDTLVHPKLIDHQSIAEDRPTDRLKNSESYQKLLKVFISELQLIEQQFMNITYQKDLDTVEGIYLDFLGKIVGLPRDGRDDEVYRRDIQLKVAINNSDGTNDIISEIMESLVRPSLQQRMSDGIFLHGQYLARLPLNEVGGDEWLILKNASTVTSQIQFIIDLTGNAIAPAWQLDIKSLEAFEVDLDGNNTLEDLQVTLEQGSSSSDILNVNKTGIVSKFLESSSGWEVPEWQESQNTITNISPLFWAVTADSKSVQSDTIELEDFGDAANSLYQYANFQLPLDFVLPNTYII